MTGGSTVASHTKNDILLGQLHNQCNLFLPARLSLSSLSLLAFLLRQAGEKLKSIMKTAICYARPWKQHCFLESKPPFRELLDIEVLDP